MVLETALQSCGRQLYTLHSGVVSSLPPAMAVLLSLLPQPWSREGKREHVKCECFLPEREPLGELKSSPFFVCVLLFLTSFFLF